jgi:GcrA cell cycle regulator
VLQNPPLPPPQVPVSYRSPSPVPSVPDARRRWTTGELTEIIAALATLRTSDIANALGVNPKALRSVLRRNGISLRALREHGGNKETSQSGGLAVRRPAGGPSATYGAAALEKLPDGACRWSLGDPAEPNFAFCGAPIAGRWPYCPAHLAQAFHYEGGHAH